MLSDISSENEEKISAMSTEEIIAEQEQLTSMLGECLASSVNHVTSPGFCYVSKLCTKCVLKCSGNVMFFSF